jgi:hypothetical protein
MVNKKKSLCASTDRQYAVSLHQSGKLTEAEQA